MDLTIIEIWVVYDFRQYNVQFYITDTWISLISTQPEGGTYLLELPLILSPTGLAKPISPPVQHASQDKQRQENKKHEVWISNR